MKQWKIITKKNYNLCVVIPHPNDVFLKETFRKGLKKKLKLAIVGMPRAMIVKVANSTKEIENEMPTTHRSR
jgi:hypothetical protein